MKQFSSITAYYKTEHTDMHKDKTAFQYNNTLQNKAYWHAQRQNNLPV